MVPSLSPFTPAERNLIRSEFMVRFGQAPVVANGIALRTWHSGPQAGQPKLPKAVTSMMERGLVEIGPGHFGCSAAHFTPAGLDALRTMARDQRALDPQRYAHVLEELGMLEGDAIGASAMETGLPLARLSATERG